MNGLGLAGALVALVRQILAIDWAARRKARREARAASRAAESKQDATDYLNDKFGGRK